MILTPQQISGLQAIISQLQGPISTLKPFHQTLKLLEQGGDFLPPDPKPLKDLLEAWPKFSPPDLDWVLPLIDALQPH